MKYESMKKILTNEETWIDHWAKMYVDVYSICPLLV